MDASVFAKMLSDPGRLDLRKIGYKYGQENLQEFLALRKQYFYQELPLHDFDGNSMVYLDKAVQIPLSAARVLLTPQQSTRLYGTKALEDEILSTFRIEQIDTSRESVRRILSGQAPENEEEHRICGMKQGLEFIADRSHAITEENLFRLYQMTIGDFLPEEDRLLPGHWYRHDGVTVIDGKTEHIGLPWQKLPAYMKELMAFAAEKAAQNDLIKAAILHFGLAYLHPYFDGNGRMARLLHLWYLVQQGYSSALFVPMSRFVEESRSRYMTIQTADQRFVLDLLIPLPPGVRTSFMSTKIRAGICATDTDSGTDFSYCILPSHATALETENSTYRGESFATHNTKHTLRIMPQRPFYDPAGEAAKAEQRKDAEKLYKTNRRRQFLEQMDDTIGGKFAGTRIFRRPGTDLQAGGAEISFYGKGVLVVFATGVADHGNLHLFQSAAGQSQRYRNIYIFGESCDGLLCIALKKTHSGAFRKGSALQCRRSGESPRRLFGRQMNMMQFAHGCGP